MPIVTTRKRKSVASDDNAEIMAPKNKVHLYDEAMQEEEVNLGNILFGGTSTFLESLQDAEKEGNNPMETIAVDSGIGESGTDSDESEKLKPAWIDEDDDGIDVGNALNAQGRTLPDGGVNSRSNQYSNLLREKFVSIVGTPKWAEMGTSQRPECDDDEVILRTAGVVHEVRSTQLRAGKVEMKKVNNLNCESYNEGPFINCVEFHPTSSVSLIAGQSGIVTLYAVDGKRNNKLHSVQFERFPVRCAKFAADGNVAFLGSNCSHMFYYDLLAASARKVPLPSGMTQMKQFLISPDGKLIAVAGKWGEIHVLSSVSKEKLFTLKQNGEVTAMAFDSDGSFLMAHSDSGEISTWDWRMRKLRCKFDDDGCLVGTAIDISPSGQFVATGSAQGVVNIYDLENIWKSATPTPRKSIMNLRTAIGGVQFNSTSECMSFHSADIENAVRIYHLHSQTVFDNFPSYSTKLGRVNAVNFSPGSGFFAIGNNKSTVSLFRLKHFHTY